MYKFLIAFALFCIAIAAHHKDGPDCFFAPVNAWLYAQDSAKLVQAWSMPQDSTKPAPKPAFQPTAHDYEYTFYPMAKYQEYQRTHAIDSATMNLKIKIDTMANTMPVKVDNRDGVITIRNLSNSLTVYRQEVDFVGLSGDGTNTLVYTARTQGKETVAINPTFGFAIIIFKSCTLKIKGTEDDCDYRIFYFGDIPNRTYAPK